MSDTPCPCENCVTWDLCDDCCTSWADNSPEVQCRATALAWSTLRLLTGGRVGSCPVMMRPCVQSPCSTCNAMWLNPVVHNGQWYNLACPPPGCSCVTLHEIAFPGEVAEIIAITIDGEDLVDDAWRLDGNRLLRTDDSPWPACQYMDRPMGSPGTFGVHYVPGIKPGPTGEWAAGLLACEFARACTGAKCRLPRRAQSVTRTGITIDLSQGMFPEGITGIDEVDGYIMTVNPHKLKKPSMVWSPDMPSQQHRFHEVP